jgi:hypothetical protein
MAQPVTFKRANRFFPAPRTARACERIAGAIGLHVWSDGQRSVTRWKLTWRERLQVLLHGHVWVSVASGWTQPPVAVDTRKEYLREVSES